MPATVPVSPKGVDALGKRLSHPRAGRTQSRSPVFPVPVFEPDSRLGAIATAAWRKQIFLLPMC